jgi:hypothetical protein
MITHKSIGGKDGAWTDMTRREGCGNSIAYAGLRLYTRHQT